MKSMLKHELCHLFGAADLNEKTSIMNSINPSPEFDEFTTQLILLNKNRNFNPHFFPLPQNKLDEAISIYNQRKKLNRREVDVNILLATFHLEKKDYESMEKECLQAIQIEPDYFEAHSNLGNMYFKKNRFSDSAFHYKKAVEITPDFAQAYNNLAVVLFYQKKYDLAWEYLKKAEELGIKIHSEFKKELLNKLKKK